LPTRAWPPIVGAVTDSIGTVTASTSSPKIDGSWSLERNGVPASAADAK
jgi:hypothetical protein